LPQVSPPSSDQIRSDIDQTREELGETVAAVADKADVKKQAKAKVHELGDKAKQAGAFLAGLVLGRILSR
jgi:Protein of unknown function (DUF3618)